MNATGRTGSMVVHEDSSEYRPTRAAAASVASHDPGSNSRCHDANRERDNGELNQAPLPLPNEQRQQEVQGKPREQTIRSASPRRRSLSIASAEPSAETVIVKAKRAAATLWTLLHAQNCVFSAGKCPKAGCAEARLLHLHLKTCEATGLEDCPTMYHGCDQARKLLSHYRRCRSIRAKQQASSADAAAAAANKQVDRERNDPSRSSNKQQQVCLLCSLVARQARTLLEQGNTTGSRFAKKPAAPPLPPRLLTSSNGQYSRSNPSPATKRQRAGPKMPPPPPRARFQFCRRVADESSLRAPGLEPNQVAANHDTCEPAGEDFSFNAKDTNGPEMSMQRGPLHTGLTISPSRDWPLTISSATVMGMSKLSGGSVERCETIIEEGSSQCSKEGSSQCSKDSVELV